MLTKELEILYKIFYKLGLVLKVLFFLFWAVRGSGIVFKQGRVLE